MNYLLQYTKLSRDIINITSKYLLISKNEVKRNYKLVKYNMEIIDLNYIKKSKWRFCYCPFCDELTYYYLNDVKYNEFYKYVLNSKLFICSGKCSILIMHKENYLLPELRSLSNHYLI